MPRSLIFYVAASSIYAALVYIAVHATYGLELGRSGVRLPDPTSLVASIDIVGFAIWIGLSLIAAIALHRLATALQTARGAGQARESEIGSIFALGQALAGSLELDTIADKYLATAQGSLDPSVTCALYVQDDTGGFTRLRERGPHEGRLGQPHYMTSALPGPVRTRVVDHQGALVIVDTTANPAWPPMSAGLVDAAWIRSFAALPLVSHERLVGITLLASPHAEAVNGNTVQLASLVTQFVASAVRTSLSFTEAQRRADREATVSRVAQRARASLDPDQVLRTAVEELGRAVRVWRALAALGTTQEEMRVAQEWVAPGVTPLGIGSTAIRATRVALAQGRTIHLADAQLSRLATPIVIGGRVSGALALHAEPEREWSVDDERLLEAVAREVRGAMEAARLFQSRERENERLLALQRASSTVAARSTTREVIDEVLRITSALLSGASASLYLWDRATASLRLAQNGDPHGRDVSATLSQNPGSTGDLLSKLEPVIANDYQAWDGATPTGLSTGVRAVLAVPLVRTGELVGAIVLRAYDENTRFTIDDARLLVLFGDQAVTALTNAEAFERQRIAMEQLEKVNRAKSEFVSIVSHEFRTPLTGIQGFSEIIRDEDLSAEEVKEYASDINKDAQRLSRMISEMLDLDRMEAGRMSLHRERTDLNAIVREAAERLRPNAPSHEITLRLAPDLPEYVGDRDRLTQVVSNLLSNAVKYSPTGGTITITSELKDGGLHVAIADQGMGIPGDMLESIWERYARVESDRTRGIQGTGLGLPIVRQIVTMHGGRVWAESEIGRGSVFHVLLPLAATGQAVEA